jgi:hypothetical protein
MKVASFLTVARLHDVLDYDQGTGEFRWRKNRYKTRIGKVAGYLNGDGHRQIRIDGRAYYAHRLAWLHVHGCWPVEQVDHRDVDPDNNAFDNLRAASNRQNRQNVRSKRADGRKGIHFDPSRGKWQAAIRVNGKRLYLGWHTDADLAAEAYARAAAEHFGEFARAA